MNSTAPRAAGNRLVAVDALRGLAAMAVVLFHYTTRFTELFGGQGRPSLSVPYGYFGVNLFFVISGFVIFMTLERTKRPMDFVVSRFSRLFPAYWASVLLTFCVVAAVGLPGKQVTGLQALANVFMVHGFFGVPHVDDVYWTLEVEMLFYAWMLLLFVSRLLHRVHVALWVLLLLRVLYHVMAAGFGIDLSWRVSQLLILTYIPWFALGICAYQLSRHEGSPRALGATVALALGSLIVVDGWQIGLLALVFAATVWAAASGRANWLGHPVLAFFGAISYPLYLVHENIGWVLQRALQKMGAGFDASVLVALALAIALASALTYAVERPSMRAIRRWYAARSASPAP